MTTSVFPGILAKPRVSTRIFGLVGFGVAVLAVLAIVNKTMLVELAEGEARQSAITESAGLALHIEEAFVVMEAAAGDFANLKDEAAIARYEAAAAKASERISRLEGQELGAEQTETLASIAATAQRHTAAFGELVAKTKELGLTEKQGVEGALRKAVHGVEEALKTRQKNSDGLSLEVTNRLLIKMLMMRRHEKDYMLRGNSEKYMGRIRKREAEFLEILDGAPFLAQEKEDFKALLQAYVSGVLAFAESADRRAAVLATVRQETANATPLTNAIVEALEARLAQEQMLFRQQTERFETTEWIMIGIAALVFAVIGWLIARSIVAPLREMRDNITGLADNDVSIVISNTSLNNEIGDIAKALEVLKANALRQNELEVVAEQAKKLEQAEAEKRLALLGMAERVESETRSLVDQVSVKAERMVDDAAEMTK